MFKYAVCIFALIACAAAKPGIVTPFAYSAPLVGPGVITATSNQVIARNYNGFAAAPIVAAAPFPARYLATPLAYTAPLAAAQLGYASAYGYASPLNYAGPAHLFL